MGWRSACLLAPLLLAHDAAALVWTGPAPRHLKITYRGHLHEPSRTRLAMVDGGSEPDGILKVLAPDRSFDADKFLDPLTRYSDDGYTLSTPLRYSVADWWDNILCFPESQLLRRVQSHLIFNTVWAMVVTTLCYTPLATYEIVEPPPVFKEMDIFLPFELSGGILGILLAFRTSQSYDRFWHGRQIWAKVINKVRSIARIFATYMDTEDPKQKELVLRWLASYPVALKQHLRAERSLNEFDMLRANDLAVIEQSDNMPLAVCVALSELVNSVKSKSGQSAAELVWWQTESMISELMDTVGEGEAIAGTPVPVSYSRHTSRLLSLWTILMPFVLVHGLPPLLVTPATAVVSWMLLATEELGHIIEEPFGIHDDRPNILPLQRYCDVIARDLIQLSQGSQSRAANEVADLYSSPRAPPSADPPEEYFD